MSDTDIDEAFLTGLGDDIARVIEAHDDFECPDRTTYRQAALNIAKAVGKKVSPELLRLRGEVERLTVANEEADARIEELEENAEAVSVEFEKDCWRAIRGLLDKCGFEWDADNPVLAEDATEFIDDYIVSHKARADALQAQLKKVQEADDFRWLIEAPGTKYLAVVRFDPSTHFEWTNDANKAIAFRSKEQCDDVLDALRQIDRTLEGRENGGKLSWGKLFAFEPTIGNARAVEHGWHQLPSLASLTEGETQRCACKGICEAEATGGTCPNALAAK